MKRFALTFFCFFLLLQAGFSTDKGLKALSEKKYDQALAYFTQTLAKNPDDIEALYGMTLLYTTREFSQFDIEKAYVHVINAKEVFKTLDEKTRKKLIKAEIQETQLLALQEKIDSLAFQEAVKAHSAAALDGFIRIHRTSPQLNQAQEIKTQLEYLDVQKANTYQAYADYMRKYPKSEKRAEAQKKYDLLLYQALTETETYEAYKSFLARYPNTPYLKEATEKMNAAELKNLLQDNSLEGYETFLANNPESKFRRRVEDSIYARFTSFPSIKEYENFIARFPTNHNVRNAWEKLYILFNDSGTPESYESFKARYPQYSEAHQLDNDIELSNFGMKMLNTNFEGFKEDQVDAYITLAAPTEQSITVLKLRIKPYLQAHQYQKAIDLLEKYKPYYHYKEFRIASWIDTLRQVKDNYQENKSVSVFNLN